MKKKVLLLRKAINPFNQLFIHNKLLNRKMNVELIASWNGRKLPMTLPLEATIYDVKQKISEQTKILPEHQKLIGLLKGKLPEDCKTLRELGIQSSKAFMVVGTPVSDILKEPSDMDLPEILDDFNEGVVLENRPWEQQENIMKLQKVTLSTEVRIINPPRPSKKLLVLDLDYTLFDCKGNAAYISQLARPGLHEFLSLCYLHYDLVVWSQTSWKWLEMKITELGMLTHDEYRLSFVLDQSSMFSVTSMRKSKTTGTVTQLKHQVKPLALIWAKFPDAFCARNTIHVDDLSRNFAMNPSSGLKVSAFKSTAETRQSDKELIRLGQYLHQIASHDDFQQLDHSKWKQAILNKK